MNSTTDWMDSDIIVGDWGPDDYLLLVEDEGPRGLGRVLGYMVFATEEAAQRYNRLGWACDLLHLFEGEEIPADVQIEITTDADFRKYYGNRMPLCNRYPDMYERNR